MHRFIENFIVFIVVILGFESLIYLRDYNDLIVTNNYIVYDIQKNNLTSFSNDKYIVNIIYEKEDVVSYEVFYKRESLLNIKVFKTIKYNGIVKKSKL